MLLTGALAFLALTWCWADAVDVRPHAQGSFSQTWNNALESANVQETPITRLVDVLKEMQGSLKKEMDEDEVLYEEAVCWCNSNKYQKSQAIESAEAQIASLESTIEELTGKIADLKSLIAETSAELEADKQELAEATALRQQQLKAFQTYELDAIQNVETLKAAIVVLGKHHAAFPQVSLLSLASRHKLKWSTGSSLDRQFARFLSKNDFAMEQDTSYSDKAADSAYSEFLHNQVPASAPTPSEAADTIASSADEAVKVKLDIPLDTRFDRFLSDNDFDSGQDSSGVQAADRAYAKFLQNQAPASPSQVLQSQAPASVSTPSQVLQNQAPASVSTPGQVLQNQAHASSSSQVLQNQAPASVSTPSQAAESMPSQRDEAEELKPDISLDGQSNHFSNYNDLVMGQGPTDLQDHADSVPPSVPTPSQPGTTTAPKSDETVELQPNIKHDRQFDPMMTPSTSQPSEAIWSHHDEAVVAKAVHSMSLFLQAHGRAAYTQPSGAQSGEILGVMKQLKEEMEDDLSEAQKEEAERAGKFTELRNAKTAEIGAGEDMLTQKKPELAKAQFDLANDKEDLAGLEAQLPVDQKFLASLKKTCKEADQNYVVRKKSRLDEIQAVSETIGILTSDEARDTFGGAFKFFQVRQSSKVANGRRALAAGMLRKVAKNTGNPELSVLATSVELDAFTKVKAAIDTMISTLKIQQANEVKKTDWCSAEFDENKMQTMKAEDLKQDQINSVADLDEAIKTLTDEIGAAKGQITDMQVDIQRASENRVKENADFQKTVSDQVSTQKILAQALNKLAAFYDAKMLVQVAHAGSKHRTRQPAQKEYKKSAGANSVMSLIEKLILDAKELEKESRMAENEAESQYQNFLADSNASMKELQEAVVTKSETKAKADKELVETKEALSSTMTDLEDLAKYKAGLGKDCDFLLKNFGVRQEARAAEIEGLKQAKQILSGAMQ